MGTITANDIKRRGVASIAEVLDKSQEATIFVRGKDTYVVMSMAQYTHLCESGLEAALTEARRDREAGRVVTASVAEHVKDLGDA